MAGKFQGVTFNDCDVGISAPASMPLEVIDSQFNRTRQAVDFRDPPSLRQSLGFPENVPPELIIEAIRMLKGLSREPVAVQQKALGDSRLMKTLGAASDVASIYGALVSPQALSWLEAATNGLL